MPPTRTPPPPSRPPAGEDEVRASGVPFAIVRPVALTEEPAGAELVLEQGDCIRGKVSRYGTSSHGARAGAIRLSLHRPHAVRTCTH